MTPTLRKAPAALWALALFEWVERAVLRTAFAGLRPASQKERAVQGAIFHFDLARKNVKRGDVHAASDYRARAGADATRGGHAAGGLVGWSGSRVDLWTAAEKADTPKRQRVAELERRRERSVARSVIVALPDALSPDDRVLLVEGYAQWLRQRHGVATQWDIHEPGREGDQRNHHAHLLITTRTVNEARKFGNKTTELDKLPSSTNHIRAWREEWSRRTNRALQRAGRNDLQVDHRSHKAVALETGAIPLPARPRELVGAYQRAREREGVYIPAPAWTEALRLAREAETAKQAALQGEKVARTAQTALERLQENAQRLLMVARRQFEARRIGAPGRVLGDRRGRDGR